MRCSAEITDFMNSQVCIREEHGPHIPHNWQPKFPTKDVPSRHGHTVGGCSTCAPYSTERVYDAVTSRLEQAIREKDECKLAAALEADRDAKSTDHHVVGESGAKSSGWKPPYHLIPWEEFAEELAARYQLGIDHGYEEDNWRKGLLDRQYVLDRASHFLDHAHRAVESLRRGELHPPDNDLAAAMWGCVFLMASRRAKIAASPQPDEDNKESIKKAWTLGAGKR